MAPKCEKEKNAYDKAVELWEEAWEQLDEWARAADQGEDDAEQYKQGISDRCKNKGAECYADEYRAWNKMVVQAKRARANELRFLGKSVQRTKDAVKAKQSYHRCLDRKK